MGFGFSDGSGFGYGFGGVFDGLGEGKQQAAVNWNREEGQCFLFSEFDEVQICSSDAFSTHTTKKMDL